MSGKHAGQFGLGAAGRWWLRRRYVLAPLVLLLCVTLPHLCDGDWLRGDSAWYAAIGLQGWRTGDLWALHEAPGRMYFNKPPLVFWMQGAWMSLAGAGAWQARGGSIAAGIICVGSVAGIARRLHGRRAGMVVGSLLALNVEFFRRTREISLDMWQCAFMLVAVWALVRAAGSRRWAGWSLAAGIAVGAALMCKPLVGLVAPVMVPAWMLACSRGAEWRRALGTAGLAIAVGIAVAAPWHVSMIARYGDEFTSQYFGREIADRASGALVGGQKQLQPAWFYLANVASAWSMWALGIAAGVLAWGRWLWRRRGGRLLLLGLVWGMGWLVLLSVFPDRRDRYAIPMHAGLAIALGALVTGRSRAGSRILRWGPAAAIAGAAVLAILPVKVQREVNPQWPEFNSWVREQSASVWDGGFAGAPAARMYVELGSWPRTTRDRTGRIVDEPPAGAILAYHRRGGWSPGPTEQRVWEKGDLVATRLGEGGWRPREVEDPGE